LKPTRQLAQSYVEPQEFRNLHSPIDALTNGTVFKELQQAAGTEGKKIKVEKGQESLLELTALGFMATDLQLYLDAYPTDTTAVKVYNDIVEKYALAKENYEKKHGVLNNFITKSQEAKFSYINSPWPWD